MAFGGVVHVPARGCADATERRQKRNETHSTVHRLDPIQCAYCIHTAPGRAVPRPHTPHPAIARLHSTGFVWRCFAYSRARVAGCALRWLSQLSRICARRGHVWRNDSESGTSLRAIRVWKLNAHLLLRPQHETFAALRGELDERIDLRARPKLRALESGDDDLETLEDGAAPRGA
eukprot:1376394-Prymnesium_polylepis.1